MRYRHADGHTRELKPCPFCGNTDIDPEGWASYCGASGPACFSLGDDGASGCGASAESSSAWNQRATESVMLAALREAREHIASDKHQLEQDLSHRMYGDNLEPIRECKESLATIDAAIQQATGGSDE